MLTIKIHRKSIPNALETNISLTSHHIFADLNIKATQQEVILKLVSVWLCFPRQQKQDSRNEALVLWAARAQPHGMRALFCCTECVNADVSLPQLLIASDELFFFLWIFSVWKFEVFQCTNARTLHGPSTHGGGFFLVCVDFGRMLDNPFLVCAFFFFFLKWKLARAHYFHSLGQDQSTVSQLVL